jgi:hypothetical protein
MSILEKIGRNIFSICSSFLVLPLVLSIFVNFIFYALRNYYLLRYLNLITETIMTIILGVSFANPIQKIVFIKYYFIASCLSNVGTLLYVFELSISYDYIFKILSLWVLCVGYFMQFDLSKKRDKKILIVILIGFISLTSFYVAADLGIVYFIARRITMNISSTIMWILLFAIPSSLSGILNLNAFINYNGLIERILISLLLLSYFCYIILIYIISRFYILIETTYMLPLFQSFIWLHFLHISIVINIINFKYESIQKKDTQRKEKKMLKMRQRAMNEIKNDIIIQTVNV